jgi:hypothetical protein
MEEQMRYQAEMLAQVLRLAQVKVQALVQAVPEQAPRLEVEAQLLQEEVQAVLRQAVALQQLLALPQEEHQIQVELFDSPFLKAQMEELIQSEYQKLAQRELAAAEVLAEVLEPGAQVLVEAPLLEAE